jgi:hypothetical protein
MGTTHFGTNDERSDWEKLCADALEHSRVAFRGWDGVVKQALAGSLPMDKPER